tara:strand:+ start:56 stop:694 length:639 start_codon:yes stop_codon:yes gene_type:complete
MNNYRLSNLFAIPLMEFQYDQISEQDHQEIKEILKDTTQNITNKVSKETYVLDKHLPKLRKFFESCITTYVEKVIIGDEFNQEELDFQITQSWVNLTQTGQSHHTHTHANSFISGVFYIKANSSLDNITFINDITCSQALAFDAKKYNQFNSSIWSLPVLPGRLILFPSYLPHRVDTTKGSDDRISLSFNVFPFGVIGSRYDLTELRISNHK